MYFLWVLTPSNIAFSICLCEEKISPRLKGVRWFVNHVFVRSGKFQLIYLCTLRVTKILMFYQHRLQREYTESKVRAIDAEAKQARIFTARCEYSDFTVRRLHCQYQVRFICLSHVSSKICKLISSNQPVSHEVTHLETTRQCTGNQITKKKQ